MTHAYTFYDAFWTEQAWFSGSDSWTTAWRCGCILDGWFGLGYFFGPLDGTKDVASLWWFLVLPYIHNAPQHLLFAYALFARARTHLYLLLPFLPLLFAHTHTTIHTCALLRTHACTLPTTHHHHHTLLQRRTPPYAYTMLAWPFSRERRRLPSPPPPHRFTPCFIPWPQPADRMVALVDRRWRERREKENQEGEQERKEGRRRDQRRWLWWW